ncbi:MAG: response regulator [Halobacteriovoraceae bacterium]|nr:response regulator [Halobacteriovoraceae bacterium]
MNKKILIIEDEILIGQSLKILFENKGFHAILTQNGVDGINKILNDDFDLIICDLMLNDISGFDILEDSLKKYRREDIPRRFIIMSAYSSAQISERARRYNCLFLSKPFDNINATVDSIIERMDFNKQYTQP